MLLPIAIIAIIFGSGALIATLAISTTFMLKKEKIKAEAMIKVEEIQAKNRLDIELLLSDQSSRTDVSDNNSFDMNSNFSEDNRKVRELKKQGF